MIARKPAPFSLVVDTVLQLTEDDYEKLAQLGFKARGGYVDLVNPEELAVCLKYMGFFAIGFAHESNLITQVKALGLPEGCTVYQDVEAEAGPAEAVIARVNACAASLKGYQAGGYFGAQSLLRSSELTALAVTTYWKGCSRVLDRDNMAAEPARGYAMVQLRPPNVVLVNGKQFDVSIVADDYCDAMPSFVWGRT